ncbi:hypothetical protein [Picosynechococcus sp. PCC 73109]|uniref:hypothetical protein n=1 Tax=Picosynechococcus sp. PCC 73109 TaxID=374982 RepID=UPI0007457D25|nr:hypothetical protein [Picosynechococcus sp. PCC 73109]AMA08699.1 hypothetical protein AWQ23_04840 [Picosynechococcus sp. PCC 73109]
MNKLFTAALSGLSFIVVQQAKSEPVFIDFDYQYRYGYEYNYDYDDYTYYYHANVYTYSDDSVVFPVKVLVNAACQQPQYPIVLGSEADISNGTDVLIEESNVIIDNDFSTNCSAFTEKNVLLFWEENEIK